MAPRFLKIVAVYPHREGMRWMVNKLKSQPSISGYRLVDGQPQAVFGHVIAGYDNDLVVYRVGERHQWKLLFDTGRHEDFDWGASLSQPAFALDTPRAGMTTVFEVCSGNGGLRLVLSRNPELR